MAEKGLFPGIATGIGSLPLKDMDAALDLVFDRISDCPHWPQLQSLRPTERMEIQPLEGMPGITFIPEKNSVYVDTVSGEAALADFYEKALAAEGGEGLDNFSLTPEYAEGFHAFLERLARDNSRCALVKAQLIGPFSLGFSINDQDGRAIIFNSTYADICMKILALKSVWQLKKLEPYAENVLFFLDEPILTSYGSTAMLTVSRDEVIGRLNQVVDPLREAGAIVGTHCCGNTDWGLVMESRLEVINFDAYNYGETLGIYANEANAFMERGGWFAPGIVPTSEAIESEDEQSLLKKLQAWIQDMAKAGIKEQLLRDRIIITPACGLGTMKPEQADDIYRVLAFLQKNYKV